MANKIAKINPPGKQGYPVQIFSNHFQVSCSVLVCYQYVVVLEPDVIAKKLYERKQIISKVKKEIETDIGFYFTQNGSTLYAFTLAKSPVLEYKYEMKDNARLENDTKLDGKMSNVETKSPQFQHIYLKTSRQCDMKDTSKEEVQMILNLMMKKLFSNLQLVQIGKKFFEPKTYAIEDSNDLQILKGFTASISPSIKDLTLSFDICHRVMHKQSVRSVIDNFQKQANQYVLNIQNKTEALKIFQNTVISKCWEELCGSMVIYFPNNQSWRIDMIDFKRDIDSKFALSDGSEISFRQHAMNKYPKYKEQISRISAQKGMIISLFKKGNKENEEIVLIPELCCLTGITDRMRTNGKLMKALANITRKSPVERKSGMEEQMKLLLTKDHIKKQMEFMKLSIASEAMKINARILGPFALNTDRGNIELTNNKKEGFANDLKNVGFLDMPRITKFGIFYIKNEEQYVKSFMDIFVKISNNTFGEFKRFAIEGNEQLNPNVWDLTVKDVQKKHPELLLVFIPQDDDGTLYSYFKHCFTVQTGTITQAINMNTLEKAEKKNITFNVVRNIFNQIMAKLNCFQWTIDLTKNLGIPPNTMFVGLDVCHDKKYKFVQCEEKDRNKSTVGFVASYNNRFDKFNSWVTFQPPRTEYVMKSEELLEQALLEYKKHNKVYPANIIIYRDGVGDSQLRSFVEYEMLNYNNALRKLQINPKMVEIVVQKRISTRFFAVGDNKEIIGAVSGTVVDTGITSRKYYDFYLVPSRAPKLATARPTRFIVLRNDPNLSSDLLEQMTYNMCLTYPGWSGPIRSPTCTMLSHKIAYLFGRFVYGEPNREICDKQFYL